MSAGVPTEAESPDGGRYLNKTVILVLIAMAQVMVILDATVVNVALPTIGRELELNEEGLQWVVNSYTLIFGGFLLLGGRAADLLGRRVVFMVGLVIFSVASLVGGLAQSDEMLIIARGVQGLGGAIISPAALSILTVTFAEGPERNRALGIWGAIAGAGAAIGVLLGGVLTEYAGWRYCFLVNLPVGLVAAFLAPRFIPESKVEGRGRAYDVSGAVTATAGLLLLVYAMVKANDYGWTSNRELLLLGGTVVLLGLFLLIEARLAKEPLVPLGVFRNRTLSGANIVGLLLGLALFGFFFYLSIYLQQVLGYSAIRAGLSYLPFSAAIIVASGIASVLIGRMSVKWVLAFGLGVASVGFLLFTRITVGGSYLGEVLPAMLVMAAGMGFAFVPLTTAAVSDVAPDVAGLASALINTSQQVGGAVGLALLTYVASSRTDDIMAANGGDPSQAAQAAVEGFQRAFLVGGAFAAASILVVLLMIRRDIKTTGPDGKPVAAMGD